MLNYVDLESCWYRGLRNGNWHRLALMERVFYKAALCYAKLKTIIINTKIIVRLKGIVEKLKSSVGTKLMNAGTERAKEMLTELAEKGVFVWAPELKKWLEDPIYVFWLGLNSKPPCND